MQTARPPGDKNASIFFLPLLLIFSPCRLPGIHLSLWSLATAAGELFRVFLLRFAFQLWVYLTRDGVGSQGSPEEKNVWLRPEIFLKKRTTPAVRTVSGDGVRRDAGWMMGDGRWMKIL